MEYRTTEKTDLNSGINKVMKKDRIKKEKNSPKVVEKGTAPFLNKGFISWFKYWCHDFFLASKNLKQQSPGAHLVIFFASSFCIIISLFMIKHLFIPILPVEELEQTHGRLEKIYTPKRRGGSLFIVQTEKGTRVFSFGRIMPKESAKFEKAVGKNVQIWSQYTPLTQIIYPDYLRQLGYKKKLIVDYSSNYKWRSSVRRFELWAIPILIFIGVYMSIRMWINYR